MEEIMSKEFCPECGAEITSNTGFCPNCGAITKSLEEKVIKENKERSRNQQINKLKKYYHKENKDDKIAIFCSLFVPFLGNFYLKEDIINFVLSCGSILLIFYFIFNLFVTVDFIYYVNYVVIDLFVLMWIISIIYLAILIYKYYVNKEEYLKNPQEYHKENHLSSIAENKYLKFLPIVLVILFIIAYGAYITDTSDKLFEYETFTLMYPSNYYVSQHWEGTYDGGREDIIYFIPKNNEDFDDRLEIGVSNFSGSLKDYKNALYYGETYKNTKLLGMPAIKVSDEYRFVKDGKAYYVYYKKGGESEEIFKSITFN